MKKSTTSILSRSAIALLLVALVASLFTATGAAPAYAAETRAVSPFGLNSHMLWGYSNTTIDREMDLLKASGSAWLRIDVSWRDFEPAKGSYDSAKLAKLDYIAAQAAAHGMKVAPVVLAVPDWANGGAGRWTPPTDDANFGNFMKFMAARYAGRIDYWELGNEVNESSFWATGRNPVRYTAFLKAGYTGTKAGNANAKVITAGLAGADFGYLREMYQAGAKGYFDIVGIHPYNGGRSPYYEDPNYPGRVFGGMANVKAVMDSYGDNTKTIWATEIGWYTSTSATAVSEATQAQYVYEAYERLYNEFPYVTAMFVYGLRNQSSDKTYYVDNFGLLNYDFTKKAAYASYQKAVADFQTAPAAPAPAPAPVPEPAPAPAPAPEPTPAPAPAPVVTPKLTLTSSASTVKVGQAATLSTVISPVAQAQVRIESRPAGAATWTAVSTVTTDATGKASVKAAPTVTTEYRSVSADSQTISGIVKVSVKTLRR